MVVCYNDQECLSLNPSELPKCRMYDLFIVFLCSFARAISSPILGGSSNLQKLISTRNGLIMFNLQRIPTCKFDSGGHSRWVYWSKGQEKTARCFFWGKFPCGSWGLKLGWSNFNWPTPSRSSRGSYFRANYNDPTAEVTPNGGEK